MPLQEIPNRPAREQDIPLREHISVASSEEEGGEGDDDSTEWRANLLQYQTKCDQGSSQEESSGIPASNATVESLNSSNKENETPMFLRRCGHDKSSSQGRKENLKIVKKAWSDCEIESDVEGDEELEDGDTGFLTDMFDKVETVKCEPRKG